MHARHARTFGSKPPTPNVTIIGVFSRYKQMGIHLDGLRPDLMVVIIITLYHTRNISNNCGVAAGGGAQESFLGFPVVGDEPEKLLIGYNTGRMAL